MKKSHNIWDQIQREDMQRFYDNYHKFPRMEFRKWQLLFELIGLFFPSFYLYFSHKRKPISDAVKIIIDKYIIQIVEALKKIEYLFNKRSKQKQWQLFDQETEDMLACSEKELIDICDQFINDLKRIKDYDKWFHEIENPMVFIQYPFSWTMSVSRAVNYMNMLTNKF